ncbi:hypothetical protein [Dokdonia sp.]|uniref:hypothetical protein n=1 Tax=Dokdonia sp. TaxID=2024995 RepID=UPI003263416F
MSVFKGISFKRSNVREFLFFLLLTAIFAVLSKLSKNYTTVYTIPIQVENVPIDKVVSTIIPSTLEITTNLNGFAVLSNQFSDFKLLIDFDQLEKTASEAYRYIPDGHPLEIAEVLSGVSEITAIRPQQVTIQVDALASKEVPVYPTIEAAYETGYGPKEEATLTPTHVTVVGPKTYIDTITFIQTKKQDFTDVSDTILTQLRVDSLALPQEIKLSSYTFEYKQEVTKFTEGSFSIPVKVVNKNANDVKIFPKTVEVYFTVSLEAYESIKAIDFEVICDFSKHTNQDDFIILDLKKYPNTVKSARLGTKQIKYIVVN